MMRVTQKHSVMQTDDPEIDLHHSKYDPLL
jgi:hypothetical protein